VSASSAQYGGSRHLPDAVGPLNLIPVPAFLLLTCGSAFDSASLAACQMDQTVNSASCGMAMADAEVGFRRSREIHKERISIGSKKEKASFTYSESFCSGQSDGNGGPSYLLVRHGKSLEFGRTHRSGTACIVIKQRQRNCLFPWIPFHGERATTSPCLARI
jgi:hypothetical protein